MAKMNYKVIINDKEVYCGGLVVARNKYNHAVIEDWKDENDIQLVDAHGNVIEEHHGE